MKKHCIIIGQTKKLLRKLFVFFLFYLPVSYAQIPDSVDYFPLKQGDQFFYYTYDYRHDCIPDTSSYRETIGWQDFNNTVIINNKKYYIIKGFYWSPDTIRIENNNLYYYYSGNEVLLFKFGALKGEKWKCGLPLSNREPSEYTVTLESKTDTVISNAGRFLNCIRINIFYNIDAQETYWFAPNIGLVKNCTVWVIRILHQANINGRKYPVTKTDDIQRPITSFILHQNYPNPFNPETTIQFELNKSGKLSISIYDETGKKVKEINNYYNMPGKYEVKWDGRDKNGIRVSTGTYLYHLQMGNYGISEKMLLIK